VKKVLIGVVLLLLVIAAALFFVLQNLDRYVATLIEEYGSAATGARVDVGSVEISLSTGEGRIRGLTIGSPAGFEADYSFRLGQIHLDLDLQSLSDDVVVIDRILIEKPEVVYEASLRGTNLGAIQKNVDAYTASLGGGAKRSASEPASGAEPRLLIRKLDIVGGHVQALVGSAQGKAAEASIADIHLQDLGAKQGGLTGPQLAARILGVLTRSALQSAGRFDVEALRKGAADAAGKAASDAVKGLFGE